MEPPYESLSWKDWVWAASLGGLIAILLWLLGGSEPPIEVMEDVAVAAGLFMMPSKKD